MTARALLLFLLAVAPAAGLEVTRLESGGRTYTVCRVDPKSERLELFWRNASGVPYGSFTDLDSALRARGRKLVFAMNAGMYHGDLSPVGLYVEEGRELRPLNKSRGEGNFFLQPNGVFVVTASGAQVVETSRFSSIRDAVRIATQSGPLLVIGGRLHPAFKPGSTSRLYRNGVGVDRDGIVKFVISEDPVNFFEFASLFRDELDCPNALFLDGTISSLHYPKIGRSDEKMDLGPIIGITAPQ